MELIAVMELGVVRGSIDPHFVDNFEPALAEPAQGIGVALVLFAMMLISKARPRRSGRDSAQQKGGWHDADVCRKPNADERASICENVVCLNV